MFPCSDIFETFRARPSVPLVILSGAKESPAALAFSQVVVRFEMFAAGEVVTSSQLAGRRHSSDPGSRPEKARKVVKSSPVGGRQDAGKIPGTDLRRRGRTM